MSYDHTLHYIYIDGLRIIIGQRESCRGSITTQKKLPPAVAIRLNFVLYLGEIRPRVMTFFMTALQGGELLGKLRITPQQLNKLLEMHEQLVVVTKRWDSDGEREPLRIPSTQRYRDNTLVLRKLPREDAASVLVRWVAAASLL